MDETGRAYAFALRALTRRDHGEAELRRKMAARGFSPDAVDDAVARLKRSGYLDDMKYARNWAEAAVRNGRGYGIRIRFDLARRGIADDIAAEIAEKIRTEFDEEETIRAIVSRKFPGFAPDCDDERRKRRVADYLRRRGFSLKAILNVFRHAEG